jgi:hypothetical protein
MPLPSSLLCASGISSVVRGTEVLRKRQIEEGHMKIAEIFSLGYGGHDYGYGGHYGYGGYHCGSYGGYRNGGRYGERNNRSLLSLRVL